MVEADSAGSVGQEDDDDLGVRMNVVSVEVKQAGSPGHNVHNLHYTKSTTVRWNIIVIRSGPLVALGDVCARVGCSGVVPPAHMITVVTG